MMMEIYLSKDKAIMNNYNIDECYSKIDKYFLSHGVKKISKGVYQGNNKDFSVFACAQSALPRIDWFLKIVDQWYCRYEGDTIEFREDALESYYRIKARYANFRW